MSNMNWHDYVDGNLDPAAMAEAEEILRADPAARARVENLRGFLSAVRRESLSEPIPLARLYDAIPQQRQRHLIKWGFGGLTLAAAAVFAWVLMTPNLPKHEERATTSFATAANWIEQRTGVRAPTLDLSFGRLVNSERTADSGCFCVVVNGGVVHLGFTKNLSMGKGLKPEKRGSDRYEVGPSMVGFRANGLLWIVQGSNTDDVWSVAKAASAQLRRGT